MRILWFADGQLPAVTGSAMSGGGWIEGLRRALELVYPDVELGIASPGAIEHEPFSAGNCTYFHIAPPPPDWRIARVLRRWRHDPVPDGAVVRCEKIALAYAPDVVHVHGAEHYFGLVIQRLRVPAIVSLQGMATVMQRFVLSAWASPASCVKSPLASSSSAVGLCMSTATCAPEPTLRRA